MKRTALSALAAVIATGLLVPAAAASAAPSTGRATAPASDDRGATVLLHGTLLLVADAHRGERPGAASVPDHDDDVQAFLDVGDAAVPVEVAGVATLPGGTTLTVEVAVPDAVADAVAQGEPVPVTDPSDGTAAEEAVIPLAALDAAQDEPAPATSDLAAATAVAAGEAQEPVAASVVTVAPAATAPATSQPHEVAVAVVGVDGKTDPRYTDAEVSRLVTQTSAYWSDQTAGGITFRLAAPVMRYTSAISCTNAWDLWNEAKVKTGFQPGPERHLLLLVPRDAYEAGYCGYGLGTIGSGVSAGGLSYVADTSWPAIAHELGHNMSLQHANRLACTVASADAEQSPTGFAGGCSEAAYGDLADVMSSSGLDAAGGLGVVGLSKIGALDADDRRTVTERGVTSLVLAPLGSGAGLRAATVTDPRNGNTYHLENRQAVGRDTYGFGGGGIRSASNPRGAPAGLRVLRQGASGSSVLLDPTPTACGTTCPWDDDVVVAPGATFRSAADGVEVRTRQLADGSVVADVSVASAGEAHWPAPVPAPSPTPTPAPAPTPDPTPTPDPAPVQGAATVVTVPVVKARSTATTALPVTVTTAADRAPVAAGTVTASVGGVRLADAKVVRGRATLVLPALPRGSQEVVVAYEPPPAGTGTALAGSSAAVSLDVAGAASRVSASLARRSVTIAEPPSVAVTVTASGATPTGAVTVTEGGQPLASRPLVRGRAVVELPVQALGRHSLLATYDGDEKVVGARSVPVVLTVTPLPVSAVTATVSTATTGQQAAVTATVRAAGRPGAGGISVVRDGEALADGQLVGGRAVLRLPALPAGRHVLTVVHAGSPGVTGGTRAVTVVVTPARPSVRAVPAATTITLGSTTTVAVEVGAPGVETTGTVRLLRGRQVLDAVDLADGRAVLTVPADLPVGNHPLTVAYPRSPELAAGSAVVRVAVVR